MFPFPSKDFFFPLSYVELTGKKILSIILEPPWLPFWQALCFVQLRAASVSANLGKEKEVKGQKKRTRIGRKSQIKLRKDTLREENRLYLEK